MNLLFTYIFILIKKTYKKFNLAGFEPAPIWKPSKRFDQLNLEFLFGWNGDETMFLS